jgi:ADP-ribosyl-[dinitrogen reductase] hydrolase
MSKKKKQPPTYGVDIEGDRGIMQRHVPTGTRRLWILRGRYHGALLGLAAGDALGTTLEFKSPGTFKPLSDMVGGGPFNLQPGQWTDDTSMALCLGESLVHCHGFDPKDQMERYCRWWQEGYLSCTGRCFDIGCTVRAALSKYTETGDPFSGSVDPRSAGNGSLMRLAPVPLAYRANPELAIHYAGESSRTTHGAPAAVDACRYFAALILGALGGASKEELLGPDFYTGSLVPEIAEVAAGSFKQKNPPAIAGTGYVVKSLEAALWAFYRSNTFEKGALLAANLGDDADTTAAIFGQLGGAFYGVDGIPSGWLAKLTMREFITEMADSLLALSEIAPGAAT